MDATITRKLPSQGLGFRVYRFRAGGVGLRGLGFAGLFWEAINKHFSGLSDLKNSQVQWRSGNSTCVCEGFPHAFYARLKTYLEIRE